MILCIYPTSQNLGCISLFSSINHLILSSWSITMGVTRASFFFPCLRSSLHQTMKCSGHSWARMKMTHDREFILSSFYVILFYFISLTTQSYPSVCLSVCQSTSFMIFPTSPTFQTFSPNKTCSPSLRQGERRKGEWFQFIHPTNGPFTLLLISFITLFKMSFPLIISKAWIKKKTTTKVPLSLRLLLAAPSADC